MESCLAGFLAYNARISNSEGFSCVFNFQNTTMFTVFMKKYDQ